MPVQPVVEFYKFRLCFNLINMLTEILVVMIIEVRITRGFFFIYIKLIVHKLRFSFHNDIMLQTRFDHTIIVSVLTYKYKFKYIYTITWKL